MRDSPQGDTPLREDGPGALMEKLPVLGSHICKKKASAALSSVYSVEGVGCALMNGVFRGTTPFAGVLCSRVK
jgi:hypothetical protein